MFKGTPGPWGYFPKLTASENHKGFYIKGRAYVLADCIPVDADGVRGEANARLIAAAPELFSELKQADAQMDMAAECIEAGRYDEALLHIRSLSRARRAAIAKATGEQP